MLEKEPKDPTEDKIIEALIKGDAELLGNVGGKFIGHGLSGTDLQFKTSLDEKSHKIIDAPSTNNEGLKEYFRDKMKKVDQIIGARPHDYSNEDKEEKQEQREDGEKIPNDPQRIRELVI